MTSAQDLEKRILTGGAARASEPDPADQPPPLAVVAPAVTGKVKKTSRSTSELPLPLSNLVEDIAIGVTRATPGQKPVTRKVHVLQRYLEWLAADQDVQQRLRADLLANPVERPSD